MPISFSVVIAFFFQEPLIETQAGSDLRRRRSSIVSPSCDLNRSSKKTPRQTMEHRLGARAGQVAEVRWQLALGDGQALASPGRWSVELCKYLQHNAWTQVPNRFMSFARRHESPALLTSLALGKVEVCLFSSTDVADLNQEAIEVFSRFGFHLEREEGDRLDIPIDFRFIDFLLRAVHDP